MRPLSPNAESFLKITTREELADWLGSTDRKLRFVLYKLVDSQKYTTFTIKKRNGTDRQIDAPRKYLKSLLRSINEAIQEIAPATGIAKGFVKSRSIFDHARIHRSKKWVVLADLKDFFPTIHFGRVRGAFLAPPFSFPPGVATCIAQLCCKDSSLPQGAPTSPAISNLICRRLDRELVTLAKANRVSVSRYADDICFSTNLADIPQAVAIRCGNGDYVAGEELVKIVTATGFQLNPRKFRVRPALHQQMVTGLVVNDRVGMPKVWRRQLRVILHLLSKHKDEQGLEIVSSWKRMGFRNKPIESLAHVVRGKTQFAHWLDKRSGSSFVAALHRSYPALKELMPRIAPSLAFRIMTEGDSDALHLQAALNHFHGLGEFFDLKPRFENYPGDKGDMDLLETLKRIAKANIDELVIGLFDCDNLSFMKSHASKSGGTVRLGSRVYAIFLAHPNEAFTDRFCVESLYPRNYATLFTTEHRRIFFGDEFDINTGLDKTGKFRRSAPRSASVVVSDKVVRVEDGYSSLLSKMDFARMVLAGAAPFTQPSFEGFRPTLSLLRSVVDSTHTKER